MPEILLQNIRIKMKQNSILVCSISNIQVLSNLVHLLIMRDFEYAYLGIRDTTHIRFYTRKSIIRFLKDNAKIEKIIGINPIRTLKTSIPLGILQVIGHGDIRYHQYRITAKF
jgi:hypothetical protein